MYERTQPGPMWLTVIPRGASSIAIVSTIPLSPAFVAPYTDMSANGIWTCTDDVTTMRPPFLAREHRARGRLAHVERAAEVDGDDPVEALLRDVEQGTPVGDAGVGADDVERTEVGLDALHHRIDRSPVGDVCLDEEGAATEPAEGVDELGRLGLGRDVVHGDVAAFLGEALRDSATDAALARGTGHQGDLAVQSGQGLITVFRTPSSRFTTRSIAAPIPSSEAECVMMGPVSSSL